MLCCASDAFCAAAVPRVFLDVDDLQDIGDLEGYVRATGVMLFFLSKKYFQSRSCLREIRASLEQEKP